MAGFMASFKLRLGRVLSIVVSFVNVPQRAILVMHVRGVRGLGFRTLVHV
jgi:hypothetical protein